MRKQILSAFLVIAMVGSVFTGCGQSQSNSSENNAKSSTVVSSVQESTPAASTDDSNEDAETTERISEETITLTVTGQYDGGTKDWNSTLQFAEYEKRLGIKFDATVYDSEQWDSKLTLMLASDNMPDIISNAKMTALEVAKYGKEGYFLDFSQYLDIMPNLSRIMEKYPAYASAIKNQDGAIYAFSVLNAQSDSTLTNPTWFSKKWCDNLGLELPSTLEDLYDVLVAFRDQDANGNGDTDDEIPLGVASNTQQALLPILWAHGIYSYRSNYYLLVDDNNQLVLGDTTENYKDFLKYIKKLYDEGLINKDAFVITAAEMNTKFTENQIGLWYTYGSIPGDKKTDWIAPAGYINEKYSPNKVMVLKSPANAQYNLAVNANTEYPEEIAKFVDYLFTVEGSLSMRNGYDGVTFDFEEVNGALCADHTKYAEAAGKTVAEYRPNIAVASRAFHLYECMEGTPYHVMSMTDTEGLFEGRCFELAGAQAIKEAALREENVETIFQYPNVVYTEDETTERSILFTDITNYLATTRIQFITGEADIDATWDSYIAKLNEIGLERLMEIEQAAYDRYISK